MNGDFLEDENRRIKQLRAIVDLTTSILASLPLPESEAQSLIANCREKALGLFPDKEEVFNLIYPSRFRRAQQEAWRRFYENPP